ncbi:protein of unknown function DUF1275 [Beijerinckia indica subsp. indica ATCC 9039]|uniref:DUF1275 domain-containing protein n=2 Tax=Beijerinckia TaxID=532 RepID=B2IHM5_BEII9|nr:protein of unknown function DUF1275 [Beijerinckia indica subsp. indica ATCC 9039]
MTGNTAQLGIELARGNWHIVTTIGLVLVAFFCGGIVSSIIRRMMQPPVLELLLMALLLLVAQVLRLAQNVSLRWELVLLAMAAAMQGETISRFSGVALQTIVITNNLLKCAKAFVDYCAEHLCGAPRQGKGVHWAESALPGMAWVSYAIGAVSAALIVARSDYPLIVPMILLGLVIGFTLAFERGQAGKSE